MTNMLKRPEFCVGDSVVVTDGDTGTIGIGVDIGQQASSAGQGHVDQQTRLQSQNNSLFSRILTSSVTIIFLNLVKNSWSTFTGQSKEIFAKSKSVSDPSRIPRVKLN